MDWDAVFVATSAVGVVPGSSHVSGLLKDINGDVFVQTVPSGTQSGPSRSNYCDFHGTNLYSTQQLKQLLSH
jgi:hypothetical protein